jgi:hypothetical protein
MPVLDATLRPSGRQPSERPAPEVTTAQRRPVTRSVLRLARYSPAAPTTFQLVWQQLSQRHSDSIARPTQRIGTHRYDIYDSNISPESAKLEAAPSATTRPPGPST